jgi:hypothetical protein
MSESATPFTEMAARITLNDAKDFAGAMVIVPPTGDPISVLLLDGSKDAGAFWSTVRARIEIVWKQLQREEQQKQTGWR